VYYGGKTAQNHRGVLMHWKIAPGQYQVILGNFHIKKVTSEELVMLLSEMLRNEAIEHKK
jgi:hypothetical protein